jgi:hypothetical protein
MKDKHKRALRVLVVGLSIVHLVWMCLRDTRRQWEFINYHGYFENTYRAIHLLVASLGLLLNKWWSLLVAIVVTAWVLYVLVVRALFSYNDNSYFVSRTAFGNWWRIMYEAQPQYIAQIALAIFIFLYSAVLLVERVWRALAKHQVKLASQ